LELERSEPPAPQPSTPHKTSAGSALPPRAANPASAASQLSEEAALLREARSRLAHGDLQGASEVLATSKAKFPNSRLAQEREAATIELLRRSGDSATAAARARAFLSRYPQSPHARQVERALPAPQGER
ncbi:MAG TPA: outer membrane protein assembly factor BamD, partial [Polyangiaceae bacterium]|nr:outer membrane protein assembly factor BamD [Polyangiaceae bacterium]